MEINVVRLLKGYTVKQRMEWPKFEKGETIFGDYYPEELKRWTYTDDTREAVRAVALDELNKYRCTYDEDGEFLCGCDYDFAPGFDD